MESYAWINQLLIEDKIDARCQPDQGARYIQRAQRYLEEGSARRARTLLIAPRGYPLRYKDDVEPFELHLALEDICDWLSELTLGARGAYLQDLLSHALSRWKRADSADRVGRRGRQFPEIYAILAEELARFQPNLRISQKPNTYDSWVYLQSANRGRGVKMRAMFVCICAVGGIGMGVATAISIFKDVAEPRLIVRVTNGIVAGPIVSVATAVALSVLAYTILICLALLSVILRAPAAVPTLISLGSSDVLGEFVTHGAAQGIDSLDRKGKPVTLKTYPFSNARGLRHSEYYQNPVSAADAAAWLHAQYQDGGRSGLP